MGLPTHILSLAALLAAAPMFGAITLESVLASMDKSAVSFSSMTGKLKKVTYTKILNDTGEPEIGAVKVKRGAGKEMKLLVEVTSPDRRAYSLQGRKAEMYFPKLKMVQEYDLGKQKDVVDQFLLLGFGTPIAELRKSYDIKWMGEEKLPSGEATARLELTPKSPKAKEVIAKVELWVLPADGHTVQQKISEASGDYRLFTYSEIQWNVSLPDASIKLNLPSDVKREHPQK